MNKNGVSAPFIHQEITQQRDFMKEQVQVSYLHNMYLKNVESLKI